MFGWLGYVVVVAWFQFWLWFLLKSVSEVIRQF